jgi:hypothetical protein
MKAVASKPQTADDFAALAEKYQLPVIGDLSTFSPQAEATIALPFSLALKLGVLPLSKHGCLLTIVVSDPLALFAIQVVQFHCGGLKLEIVVSPEEQIKANLPRFYGVERVEEQESKHVDFVSTETRAKAYMAAALKSPYARRTPARNDAAEAWIVEVPSESWQTLCDVAMKRMEAK